MDVLFPAFEAVEVIVNERRKDFMCDQIKCRLNSGNDCYHFVQNLLPSLLLFEDC
jgi:hypothetical protein